MKEKYTVKIINNDKKEIRTSDIFALDPQEAHKDIFEKINSFSEEILEITDQDGNCAYNLKNGFVS
jgi:hypothetical protein